MNRAGRITTLQLFRGVAALLVVFYHATVYSQEQLGYSFLGGLFLFGYTGVDFFFVLSGFIIYYIHAADIGDPSRLRPYLTKRLARIFPTYWIVTAIKLALIVVVPTIAKSYERDLAVIVKSILLVPQTNLPLIGAAWTLSYELLFYILFGLAILVGSAWAYRLVWVWVAATVIYTSAKLLWPTLPDSLLLQFLLNERNLEFCLGCLSAHFVMTRKVPLTPVLVISGVLLFGLAALRVAQGVVPLFYTPIFGVASFLVVTGSAAYELRNRVQVPRLLVFLGDASYSIYLTHVMFINAVVLVYRRLNVASIFGPFVTTLSLVVLSVVAASAFYFVLERPMLRWLSTRSRATPANPGLAQSTISK